MSRFCEMQKFRDRTHVGLTVLSIFQKAVTFDHNFACKHTCLAFFIKYFFAGKYNLNEKSKTNKTVSLKLFDYKPKP